MREVLSSRAGGATLALVVIAMAVMAIAAVSGSGAGRRGGPPLDPRSTLDSGTRASVIFLESHGRRVTIGRSSDTDQTQILFEDDLDDDARDLLMDQVRRGQSLIIADASSPMVERVRRAAVVSVDRACELEPLAEVTDLDLGLVPALGPGNIASCFGVGDGWLVTLSEFGEGRVIAVSSSRPFTNGRLGNDHNAALVLGVVQLTEGDVRIVHSVAGSGDRSLSDLIGQPVWAALAVSMLAVVVFGLHRGRRLGLPVAETDAVEIDGSELVAARARLYGRARSGSHVLGAMSAQLNDDLEQRWGFDHDTGAETVLQQLRLSSDDETHLRAALSRSEPVDDADFVERVAHGVHARRIVRGIRRG